MKKIGVFALLLLVTVILIAGCTTMSDSEITRFTNELAKSDRYASETFNYSYKEAFLATQSVFRDLAIEIVVKDFDNKRIVGLVSSSQGLFGYEGGAMRYLVEFSDAPSGVTVTIKVFSWMKYHYDEKFVLSRIKNELDLQSKIH